MALFAGAMLGGAMLVAVASAQDATIINARIAVGDGPVIQNGSIVVRDGKIVSVAPGRPAQLVGTVIDGTGMTAVAGFIDGHKHLNTSPLGEKEQMQDLIDNGFTTVLSALGPGQSNLALIKQIDSGQINGPHIIASERMDLHGTPEQARASIRAMAAEGIHYTGEMAVTPEPGATPQELAVLRAAVDEGKKDGVHVVVHAVSSPAMLGATEAGVRHQVHLPNKDFMSYDTARQIADSGTVVLDLISFGAPLIGVFEKSDVPRFRSGLEWPESIAGANRDAQGRALGTEAAYTLINARRIWDASGGRSLGFGSDQNYPVRDVLEHELKSLMVMFSMQDVLRIFGPNTAAFLGLQNEIGTLDPGKHADIVLFQGNPFRDFHALLHTEVVLKDGKVVVDKRGTAQGAANLAAQTSAGSQEGPGPQDGTAVGTLTLQSARPGQVPRASCENLTSLQLMHARITSAREVAGTVSEPAVAPGVAISVPVEPVAAAAQAAAPLPPHCVVTALLEPARGSSIHMELWLPVRDWNANFMMVGNEGLGGSINQAGMAEPLRRGYAVASTDTGHSGDRGALGRGARLTDFAYRAVHETAVQSRAVINAFYGGAPRYAYWFGDSPAAGRQGLKEAQMYPADFDGLLIDAPANDWSQIQARLGAGAANHARGALLGAQQLAILHRGALAQCDGADGLKDGQIEDPRSCDFKAASLVCKSGQSADSCLTAAQAQAADRIYGPRLDPKTGRVLSAGMPPGSELDWGRMISVPGQAAADNEIDATSTDLSAFEARGGKIIEYQGWANAVVSARDSIGYYESVAARQGDLAHTRNFYRLFLVPAMGHTGETYVFDWFGPLEEWVERSQAPDVVLARHIPPPGVTPKPPRGLVFEPEFGVRPMCAYPDIARLQNGRGETPVDWLCLPGPRGAQTGQFAGAADSGAAD
jgi:feruloyl esterase